MIRQPGRVVGVEGDQLLVDCETATACERCARGEGCGGGLMGALLGDRLHTVKVNIGTGDAPAMGQQVLIGLAENALLRAAALAYLPPLAGLMLGAIGAALLFGRADWIAAVGALAGLALGVLSAQRLALRRRPEDGLEPVFLGPCQLSSREGACAD